MEVVKLRHTKILPWRGILMVRSHIGNVVCRKALCVRVASSPPNKRPPGFGGLFRLPHKNRLSFFDKRFFFYMRYSNVPFVASNPRDAVCNCTVGGPSSNHIARQSRYIRSTGPYSQSSKYPIPPKISSI